MVITDHCNSPFPDFPDVVEGHHVRFRAARQTSECAPLFTSVEWRQPQNFIVLHH
jgi:hypothetical protein